MKARTNLILGIILIVVSCIALFGRIAENTMVGLPFYAMGGSNVRAVMIGYIVHFMLLVAGVIYLSCFFILRKKEQIPKSEYWEHMCTAALVAAIISVVFCMYKFVYIIAVITVVLAIAGLKTAFKYNEKGIALGKWALAIGVAVIISATMVMSITNIKLGGLKDLFAPSYAKSFAINNVIFGDKSGSVPINSNNTMPFKPLDTEVEKEYTKGILTADGFESEYLNMRFTAPEGWIMRSADGEDFSTQFEMGAVSSMEAAGVTVVVEKNPNEGVDFEQLKVAMVKNWERSGMKFISEKDPVTFLDETYDVLLFDAGIEGMYSKTEVYIRLQGDRIIYIILQYPSGNRTSVEQALKAFSVY